MLRKSCSPGIPYPGGDVLHGPRVHWSYSCAGTAPVSDFMRNVGHCLGCIEQGKSLREGGFLCMHQVMVSTGLASTKVFTNSISL